MKKFKNVAILAVAMLLICAISVGGTIAYFMSQSVVVENTFIAAKFGNPAVTETTSDYTAIPGVDIKKNPRVKYTPGTNTTDAQAEAYLYLTIELKGGWKTSDNTVFTNTISSDAADKLQFTLVTANWKYIGKTAGGVLVYVHQVSSNEVKLSGSKSNITVIKDDTVTVSPTITIDDMEATDIAAKLGSVTFGAYAVQATFNDAKDATAAWNLVNSSLKLSK
jgi:predicted ribosomally synthesized peptide with SipW-like signal peptide